MNRFYRPCPICPLTRFASQDAYRQHLGWHVSRGQAVEMVRYDWPAIGPVVTLVCKTSEVDVYLKQGWQRPEPQTPPAKEIV